MEAAYRNISFASRTGTWVAENGFAAVGFRATAAATATWTGLTGTDIRLFHRNANVVGSFRYRVDGGEWATVTPPTGFGVEPGVVHVNDAGAQAMADPVIKLLTGVPV